MITVRMTMKLDQSPADWSAALVRTQADSAGLTPTDAYWERVRSLREHVGRVGAQAAVWALIRRRRYFWGDARGGRVDLHRPFPRGGPQAQGNPLAGLLRTKGEH